MENTPTCLIHKIKAEYIDNDGKLYCFYCIKNTKNINLYTSTDKVIENFENIINKNYSILTSL